MKEIYDHANSENTSSEKPKWLEVQELAFSDDTDSFDKLMKLVLDAERTSIKLPVIRTVEKDRDFDGWSVKKGNTIILDIVSLTTSSQGTD